MCQYILSGKRKDIPNFVISKIFFACMEFTKEYERSIRAYESGYVLSVVLCGEVSGDAP